MIHRVCLYLLTGWLIFLPLAGKAGPLPGYDVPPLVQADLDLPDVTAPDGDHLCSRLCQNCPQTSASCSQSGCGAAALILILPGVPEAAIRTLSPLGVFSLPNGFLAVPPGKPPRTLA